MSDYQGASSGLSPAESRQVAQIRRGSGEAFEALFATHESLVYRICLGIVGAPDVARDLVQDLFCDLWDRRQRLDPKTSLKAYLAGAARNKALNWIRRNRPQVSLDEWDETGQSGRMAGRATSRYSATPQDALYCRDLRHALRRAVQELPARRRLIYKLAREEHLSYAEIAAALDSSPNTVKTQMGRALKFLRERLKIYDFASRTN